VWWCRKQRAGEQVFDDSLHSRKAYLTLLLLAIGVWVAHVFTVRP